MLSPAEVEGRERLTDWTTLKQSVILPGGIGLVRAVGKGKT
jgi:hypothetical protein